MVQKKREGEENLGTPPQEKRSGQGKRVQRWNNETARKQIYQEKGGGSVFEGPVNGEGRKERAIEEKTSWEGEWQK